MLYRQKYSLIKPIKKLSSEEDILNEENYKLDCSYPAAEFDDLVEFFIFLREAGVAIEQDDQIVSEYLDSGVSTKAYYLSVNEGNRHLLKSILPENTSGYQLIKKITLC